MILHMTPGERATLQWLADGRDAGQIAEAFGVSRQTLERELALLCTRMGASTLAEAVNAAFSRGLLAVASPAGPDPGASQP